MNGFKAFLREKGLYLACLALVFAAAITGVWAVRRVVYNVGEMTRAKQEAAEKALEEQNTWELPDTQANTPVTDLPEESSRPSAAPSASGSSSGAGQTPSAAQSGSGSSAGSSTRQDASPGLPVAGEAAAPYSGQELVYSTTLKDWRTHNGQDYACAEGTPVRACAAGTVKAAGTDALWGGVVELEDENGLTWRYCGLAAPAAVPGEKIAAGGAVGVVGALPAEAAEGAHLHLECSRAGERLDPAACLAELK